MATSGIAEHVGRVLIDRYRLTRPLGTGASAHVYVAEDVRLRRRVAVKLLHPALADDDAFLRRFQAEARVVAALRHQNIVRVYDWGEDATGPFLVMELLEGGSLRSLLDRGRLLTPAQAARIGADAARALDHAHRRGLVHRDIKPANLLFDDEGRVSIADFGLARALAEATWTEPVGAVLGTARYAAPEQVRGTALDGKADIYALGLVMVEAVTGTVPFAADTTIGTLMARVDHALVVPVELGPLVPVLEAAGRPEPAERPGAGELAVRLDDAASALPAPAALVLAGPLVTGETEEDPELTELPGRPKLFDGDLVEAGGERGPAWGRDGQSSAAGGAGQPAPVGLAVPGDRRERRRARKGWWMVGVLMAVVALAAGGLAATRALRPSHAVPNLVDQPEAAARRLLAPMHLHLHVAGTVYSPGVAKGAVVSQQQSPGTTLREGSGVSVILSLGPPPVSVPPLEGISVDGARDRLIGAGLVLGQVTKRFDASRPGTILSWTGEGGQLARGSPVDLVVSNGPPTLLVPAGPWPSFGPAQAALTALNLTAVELDLFSDTVPKGAVIRTVPAAGTQVPSGSTVTVVVSKGPDVVAIPDVRSRSVDGATRALEALGFTVSGVNGDPTRAVTRTSPGVGTLARRGSAVTLFTS